MASVRPNKVDDCYNYKNWIKVALALYYMKEGLEDFIQQEMNDMHTSLVGIINREASGTVPHCNVCSSKNIIWNKTEQMWQYRKPCPSRICNEWMKQLISLHRTPTSENIFWNNCDVATWPLNPWECAKVFMPRGQPPSNTDPKKSDIHSLINLMRNCKYFHFVHPSHPGKLSQNGVWQAGQVLEIRNLVMHAKDMALTDSSMKRSIKTIIKLLRNKTHLRSLEKCQSTVETICKIRDSEIDIVYNFEMEVRTLVEIVNDINQDLRRLRPQIAMERGDALQPDVISLAQQHLEPHGHLYTLLMKIKEDLKNVSRELKALRIN